MTYGRWTPGMVVTPPVYLDTNILAAAVVSGHSHYPLSITLLGELLASGYQILVSDLSVNEASWAIARLAYADLSGQPALSCKKQTYRSWCQRIFQQRRHWMEALNNQLKTLAQAGHPIDVVPTSTVLWRQAMDLSLQYMELLRLTPADAIHLALSETHARTFVTADGDFSVVHNQSSATGLVVLRLRP